MCVKLGHTKLEPSSAWGALSNWQLYGG